MEKEIGSLRLVGYNQSNVIQSFKDLKVYQESYELALIINKAILRLPNSERFDLVDQMRRASKSIPANIAEGYAKRYDILGKQFTRLLQNWKSYPTSKI